MVHFRKPETGSVEALITKTRNKLDLQLATSWVSFISIKAFTHTKLDSKFEEITIETHKECCECRLARYNKIVLQQKMEKLYYNNKCCNTIVVITTKLQQNVVIQCIGSRADDLSFRFRTKP